MGVSEGEYVGSGGTLGGLDGTSLAIIEGLNEGIALGGLGASVIKLSSTNPTPRHVSNTWPKRDEQHMYLDEKSSESDVHRGL